MENRFENWQYPEIEEGKLTKYYWLIKNKEGLSLGRFTDIGAFTYINAKNEVVIEDYVQIGGGVKIYSVNTIDETQGKIVLKKNSKIGANSVILPNVIVGENSVVGACSVVKSNTEIPANEIWAGRPARKIGQIIDGKRHY
ncbi:MAG: acyltransferase [Candidatus Pacebacteria bacterium]|nr:acyltransferase [Candidatus Paceibacterota bacterium]